MAGSSAATQLVLDGVQIIDGTGNKPIPNGRVVIAGHQIQAAGPRERVAMPTADAIVISGEGRTALPGLIDVHVHDFSDANMALYVKNGITSIRFAGGQQRLLLELRDRIERHEIPGPRIFSVGSLADGTPHAWPGSHAADSPIEARKLVRRMVEVEKVDAILATHRVTRPVLAAVVETAHDLGVPVSGQIWASDGRTAVAVGMDGLENTSRIPESDAYAPKQIFDYYSVSSRIAILTHMWAKANWDRTTEIAHLMAESGLALALEIVSFEAWAGLSEAEISADRDWPGDPNNPQVQGYRRHNSYISEHWSKADFAVQARALERMREFTSLFHRAGGLLVAGTDLSFGGILLHRELWHFQQAGLAPLEVIRTGTRQAASALGRDDLGYLGVGRTADVIVVKGDPTKDLKALRDVEHVFIGGQSALRDGKLVISPPAS